MLLITTPAADLLPSPFEVSVALFRKRFLEEEVSLSIKEKLEVKIHEVNVLVADFFMI